MSVLELTTNYFLRKFTRGHSVLDTDLGYNADIIDAALHTIDLSLQAGVKVAKGDLTAGLADAIAFAWQNPELSAIHVLQVVVDVTTVGGTGSSVMDVDVVADAVSTDDTILDGIDINADAVYSSLSAGVSGTNATENVHRMAAKGGANDHITGKILVADASALAGKYYIYYVVV